ncbi:hypothetical protein QSV08_07600 [Maribacter sp. BPC-D8]|uniref:hypothetical protein n=1 Tax=Maribacter sp. BPC-D8 TaxID=3053613 RepID=UPI002B49D23A|nr:hypothetical protein [Maribacter sp. BPC-D8]WRI31108.1 hypothetical protein QSV08_07600 [Maribacter sp. BPC-D8]
MRFTKNIRFSFILLSIILLSGCSGSLGYHGTTQTDYPYFVVTEPMIVKHILVPKGTKLIYEEHFFKEGKQAKLMSEDDLEKIELPVDSPIVWGGVPVISIRKFFNPKMRGFTVTSDFNQLSEDKKTKFSDIWLSCDEDLAIEVESIDDWSFNKINILDIQDCGTLYQRYFTGDQEQQDFLNTMYKELIKIESH